MKTNPNDIRFRAAFIFILERDWGGRQKELAYKAGVKPPTITGIKNGTTHGRPDLQVKIAMIMGFDDFDKFIDLGQSLIDPDYSKDERHPIIIQTATEPEKEFMASISDRYRAIPLYESGRLAAGSNGSEFDPHETPSSMLVVYMPELKGCSNHKLAALRVAGDSMSPTIPAGSIVVMDQDDKNEANGRLFVVNTPESYLDIASVKRVKKWQAGFALISDNHLYEIELSPLDWDRLVIGRVIWFWRNARDI